MTTFQLHFRFVIFLTKCFTTFPVYINIEDNGEKLLFYFCYSIQRWLHFCCVLRFAVFSPCFIYFRFVGVIFWTLATLIWLNIYVDFGFQDNGSQLSCSASGSQIYHCYKYMLVFILEGDISRHQTSSYLNIEVRSRPERYHRLNIVLISRWQI